MLKTCSKCSFTKPLDCFSRQAKGRLGVTSICKRCSSARGMAWHAGNLERSLASKKAYRERHKDEAIARAADWRSANPDRARATAAAWAKANKAKKAASAAERRSARRLSTPAWADRKLIANAYRWAAEATTALGVKFEVDHLYPLQSDFVCGLHCIENLVIRTMASNRSKGNRHPPWSTWWAAIPLEIE